MISGKITSENDGWLYIVNYNAEAVAENLWRDDVQLGAYSFIHLSSQLTNVSMILISYRLNLLQLMQGLPCQTPLFCNIIFCQYDGKY